MNDNRQSAMVEHILHALGRRNNRKERNPAILALITSHVIGMEPGFSYLKTLREEKMTVRFTAEDDIFTQLSLPQLIEAIDNDDWIPHNRLSDTVVQQADIIFVPILSFSIVSDILSFNEKRPFVRIILTALFTGKKVIALKLGADPYHSFWQLKGMDKGAAILKRKLYDKLNQLKTLGIHLIAEHEKIAVYINEKAKPAIITEKFIQSIYEQNQFQLVIFPGTIITPLARDRARELKIALIYE